MRTPTLADVVEAAHSIWPPELAESWDASGLVCGRGEAPVSRILLAVDPVQATAREAVGVGAQLLLTHHPLLLRGVSFLPASSSKGAVVHELIEHGIGLLCSHTNADSYDGGVSDALIGALGVTEVEPLCLEDRTSGRTGIGRVGNLPEPTTLKALAERLGSVLAPTAGGLRVAGDAQALVRRVAVCGGAGDSLFDEVRAAGADVYVTADLRHHPASEAREQALLGDGKPCLIDCSHYASEQLWLASAAEQLANRLAERGFRADLLISRVNTDPWDFVVAAQDIARPTGVEPEGAPADRDPRAGK